MSLNLSQAFKKLNAKPENINYSVSAFAEDGTLVVSLWQHYFGKAQDGILPYTDRLSRWSGRGNANLAKHLEVAIRDGSGVRAIIAHTTDRQAIDVGVPGNKVKKEFHLLEGFVGKVVDFDGDSFTIHFQRQDR
jgi:hypothetical protein